MILAIKGLKPSNSTQRITTKKWTQAAVPPTITNLRLWGNLSIKLTIVMVFRNEVQRPLFDLGKDTPNVFP